MAKESSSERGARVERRVEELKRRRHELAAGERPSAESVDRARQRAEESLQRAEDAHHASAQRHEELARLHERTANRYQRALLRGDDGSPEMLQAKADEHWQAAQDSHLHGIEDETKAAETRAQHPGRSAPPDQ
jgi:hypothetical protein